MSKIAVVYHSKHGSTQTYANWISEETGADVYREGDCKVADLMAYDTIVYGGAIHAGGILGIKFLQKNFDQLAGKQILVFAVGLSVNDENAQVQCREINLVKKLENLPCYFFRGAYDPSKISGIDKGIMAVVKKMLAGKRDAQTTDAERELLVAFSEGADYLDRESIKPLISELNKPDRII